MRVTGETAIKLAKTYGLPLQKHADPTEGYRNDVPLEDAQRIMGKSDPDLIYVEAEPELIAMLEGDADIQTDAPTKTGYSMSVTELRKNGMMAHLIDALSEGKNIGHYGQLVFVMVGRYFLPEDRLLAYLQMDPDIDEERARALIEQVASKGYSPPSREKVLEFQERQQFPICPNREDPDACNVYKDLKFPREVYESITDYHVEKLEAES